MASEMVIFTRTFDFISWLVPRLDSFPRNQRSGTTVFGWFSPTIFGKVWVGNVAWSRLCCRNRRKLAGLRPGRVLSYGSGPGE